jgi:hypothetical protein
MHHGVLSMQQSLGLDDFNTRKTHPEWKGVFSQTLYIRDTNEMSPIPH